jgi:hypothetical protein
MFGRKCSTLSLSKRITVCAALLVAIGVIAPHAGQHSFWFDRTGAVQMGMGETGVALVGDVHSVFWNPALLGVREGYAHGGAFGWFSQPNNRYIHTDDMAKRSFSLAYSAPDHYFGGVAVSYVSEYLGANNVCDQYHDTLECHQVVPYGGTCDYWYDTLICEYDCRCCITRKVCDVEMRREDSRFRMAVLSYGVELPAGKRVSHMLGVNFALYRYRFVTMYGPANYSRTTLNDGVPFSFDLGYLLSTPAGLHAGLTLMNMGPAAYFGDADNASPVPFTVDIALAYESRPLTRALPWLRIRSEYRLSRFFKKTYDDKPPDPFYRALLTDPRDEDLKTFFTTMGHHLGWELSLFNTLHLRQGLHLEQLSYGYREDQFHWGVGLSLFNHIRFDLSFIHPLYDHGVARGQAQLSLERALVWDKSDRRWWRGEEKSSPSVIDESDGELIE